MHYKPSEDSTSSIISSDACIVIDYKTVSLLFSLRRGREVVRAALEAAARLLRRAYSPRTNDDSRREPSSGSTQTKGKKYQPAYSDIWQDLHSFFYSISRA